MPAHKLNYEENQMAAKEQQTVSSSVVWLGITLTMGGAILLIFGSWGARLLVGQTCEPASQRFVCGALVQDAWIPGLAILLLTAVVVMLAAKFGGSSGSNAGSGPESTSSGDHN
jgi:hypothetical protein